VPTPVLQVRGLSKTFPGQRALIDIDMDLQPGEIRGLVGQNGCGKSTLIKILAGYHNPDPGGHVTVDDKPLALAHAGAAEHAGLRFVHQDLGLVPTLDARDNLAMGHGYERNRARLISWRREQRLTRQSLKDLGYDIDVRQPVSHLAASERTAVALARALSPRRTAPRVLVLDEPTASLPAAEVHRLFDVVRTVRDQGVAILFVSHHLDEVFGLCETVTIFRDGLHVTTRPVQGLNEDGLIALMVGRSVEQGHAPPSAAADHGREVALQVRGLRTDVISGIDLDVAAGEIVGVAGITGSGREGLALALFGGIGRSGSVQVAGRELEARRPDRSVDVGLALVPAERHANAAFLESNLRENVSISKPADFVRRGLLSRRQEVSDVSRWLQRLKVQPPHPDRILNTLSGGNQQKVMLARWMRRSPAVLILDEPTQGVDVGAKADIHALVEDAAAAGAAVLVISTDHTELTRLAERVVVLRRGQITDTLRQPNIDPDRITAATLGTDLGAVA
jgi:ribose transport system ATP-binding protein